VQVTKLCYEVKDADVARARNQLKASLLFMQDSNQRKSPYHHDIGTTADIGTAAGATIKPIVIYTPS
jgi:hypothetical protein